MIDFSKDSFIGTKLFIGAPMQGGLCTSIYIKGMMELSAACIAYEIPLNMCGITKRSLVQKARNECINAFLQTDFTHFLFIYADIGFSAKDALTLLSIMVGDKNEKYDVLAGSYPKKIISNNPIEKFSSKLTPIEVLQAGAGFMMIPRKTFERFRNAYPHNLYKISKEKTEFAFFNCGIDKETNRYFSEDAFFCRQVREMGGKIWVVPGLRLSHQGSYVFQEGAQEMTLLEENK